MSVCAYVCVVYCKSLLYWVNSYFDPFPQSHILLPQISHSFAIGEFSILETVGGGVGGVCYLEMVANLLAKTYFLF